MPIEFLLEPTGSSGNSLFRLTMAYDATGRRISKTRWVKNAGSQDWEKELVTHYTGIGTEVRENYAGPAKETKVVVNMSNGLGRYGIEDAGSPDNGSGDGDIPNAKFEWYLKNHLGSTMLVYGTVASTNPSEADVGTRIAAYDYRAFGEEIDLTLPPTGKVTENFTGKERDDETHLNYFGARYLDPMLGVWISVDPKRQFASPYLYAGNGVNPINGTDPDGKGWKLNSKLVNNEVHLTGKVEYVDDGTDEVHLILPDGKVKNFAAPPKGCYFFTADLNGQTFDPDMNRNAIYHIENAYNEGFWGFLKWREGKSLDFKKTYYHGEGNDRTVGFLMNKNIKTIMTARDAGNAIWGGWSRKKYVDNWKTLRAIANGYAILQNLFKGKLNSEDVPSTVMQEWGFYNYQP